MRSPAEAARPSERPALAAPARVSQYSALERAKGTLRTKVGAGTGVRFTPTLSFVLDKVPDTAAHMEELRARARAADEELARVRQGAKHAGDEDPYRVSGAEDSGELDELLDAEDTGDRYRQDD